MAHLTRTEQTQLAEQLAQGKRALIETVRQELAASNVQHFRDIAGQVTDQGDESVADLLADLDAAFIDRHIQQLRDIDAAQARLGEGRYGTCIACQSAIGFARLKAYPTAKRCIICQTRHEKHTQSGNPSI